MKIRDILREFAPDGGDDGGGDDGFSEETLKRLAAAWYNGDEDPRVEQTLMAAGWEIGQDEGYDDEPGVFVVQAGDVNGHSFISWPASELQQGVSEGSYTTEKQILTRIRQIMHDRKLSGTDSNAGELLRLRQQLKDLRGQQGVAEGIDIGSEWMTDTELDQYVPDQLQQQWRELVGYDEAGNVSALWANITGGYEPDVNDPEDRANMVRVANKWFAMKRIPNVKFFDVKDADDELEWLVQIGQQGVAEGAEQQLSIQQLATISDEALDRAYGYGRSTPGKTFGWQANLQSAAQAKKMIDAGITDIERIADAIHRGWNVTAQKFVTNPDQFADTEKLRAAGKLEAKLDQRARLMRINYAQLPDDEQEKDRVVARALLQALTGPEIQS